MRQASEYVVGIERSEDAKVVCGGTVTVGAGAIRGESQVRSRSLSYRGGVNADVKTPPSQFKQEATRRFAVLRKRVIQSRPSPDTVSWSIQW